MSRSGLYEDDGEDHLAHGRWRGAVASAIRGKHGQAFLRELADALDAMPNKWLVAGELQSEDGCNCTLGVIAGKRGLDVTSMDIDDYDFIADSLGVNAKIAQEVMWENDETFCDIEYVDVVICGPMRPPFHECVRGWVHEKHKRSVRVTKQDVGFKRWQHMRDWVSKNIKAQGGAV
jgi:hypothetical protein